MEVDTKEDSKMIKEMEKGKLFYFILTFYLESTMTKMVKEMITAQYSRIILLIYDVYKLNIIYIFYF